MAQAVNTTQRDRRVYRGFLSTLRDAWQRRQEYRRIHAELNALSTRELSDLGISRNMISRLAQEAAQLSRQRG